MSTTTEITPKKQRKPSREWNRHKNEVPLTERGAFQLPEAADYLSRSLTTVRRLVKKGLLRRLPGFRDVVITRAECDRFLREQTDIAQLAA